MVAIRLDGLKLALLSVYLAILTMRLSTGL